MEELTATALKLSVPERLQLVQDIWDSIAAQNATGVSQADLLEAQKRLEEHEGNPDTAISWEEVQNQLGLTR
jgi:putative addiction module component (TIGR02574 family)